MVEGAEKVNRELVARLHGVLRPFLLRRLKADVEKQLPGKHEHIVRCRLSRRQRQLYEEYMASTDTQSTLKSGSFLGILNVLMSLRKVRTRTQRRLFRGNGNGNRYASPSVLRAAPSCQPFA